MANLVSDKTWKDYVILQFWDPVLENWEDLELVDLVEEGREKLCATYYLDGKRIPHHVELDLYNSQSIFGDKGFRVVGK